MTTATALDPATLPDDPETLKKIIIQYNQRLQESAEQLQERDRQLQDRNQYVLRLQHMLAQLRRWQFGTKAERIPEGQLIFPFYGTLETVPAPPEDENRAPRARRRPRRGGYRVIPKDIPQKIVVVDLPPDQRLCPDCHQERILMGYEETKQLDFHPASFFEMVTRRAKYACKPCEGHLQTAPLPVPAGPIERGLPGFGLLAQVIIAKFCDHIPLYRQTRIYARQGVEIPRSTLCGWVGHGMRLLDPIVGAIVKDILLSRIIGTDDTVVRLLVPGLGRTAQARLWSYLGDPHSRPRLDAACGLFGSGSPYRTISRLCIFVKQGTAEPLTRYRAYFPGTGGPALKASQGRIHVGRVTVWPSFSSPVYWRAVAPCKYFAASFIPGW